MGAPLKLPAALVFLAVGVLAFCVWSVYAYSFGSSPFVLPFEKLPQYGEALRRIVWIGICLLLFIIGSSFAACRKSDSAVVPLLGFLASSAGILVLLWLFLRALGIWYQMLPDEPFTLL